MDATSLLVTYASAIRKSVAAKDNNAFWPAGIPMLSYPCAHITVRELRSALARGAKLAGTSLNPTAVLCLLLYLTHGLRRLGADEAERGGFAELLLQHVASSRSGELVPGRSLCLSSWRSLPGVRSLSEPNYALADPRYVLESFRLGAQAWALGECAFFFCHRLLTERHGMYQVHHSRFVSCRHITNLDLCQVWPELDAVDEFPLCIAVWSFYPPSGVEKFSYDLFANPVFSIDPRKDCLGAAVWAEYRGRDSRQLELDELRHLRLVLEARTKQVLALVANASARRLAVAMADVMCGVIRRVLGIRDFPRVDTELVMGPFDYRVEGTESELGRYYDLRCD